MKKILLASIFVLFLGIVPHVSAATQGFTALAPIPGLTDQSMTSVVSANTLATFLNNLYKYLIGLAAILAVIQIIWAGLDMALWHKDAVAEITSDKGKIKNAIFGLVLVLSPALVFTIINPSILNLSLNLPALATSTSATNGSGGSGTGTNQPYTPPSVTTNCSAQGTAGILQEAYCPTQNDATLWLKNNCNGGQQSVVDDTKDAYGKQIAYNVLCAWNVAYTFIQTASTYSWTGTWDGQLGELSPLASTPTNQNNGQSAMNFLGECNHLGWYVCMDKSLGYNSPQSCPAGIKTTSMPKGAPTNNGAALCYNETLSCVNSVWTTKVCHKAPSWSIFQ
jgi:hypothetical protein